MKNDKTIVSLKSILYLVAWVILDNLYAQILTEKEAALLRVLMKCSVSA